MTIGLFSAESVPAARIASCLANEEVEVKTFVWPGALVNDELTKAILVVSSHGAGEICASLRKVLTKGQPLILCAPQPDGEALKLLKGLGVSEVITPRSWEPDHISERILGRLIVDGDASTVSCGKIMGGTRVMHDLYRDIETIAPLSDAILILGESGTGKELVAAALHALSERPDQFLPVNCGELSLELAGSELFGYKKGAFTGASEARRGLFAEAGHGTIFLDEIGELDLKAQSTLLRVLEEKKVRRIGSNQTEEVFARIVLATNRDLETECAEGRFKADLFERIRGFSIELAPLRERRADIPLLVRHFLSEFDAERGTRLIAPDGVIDNLFGYDWPGNVRELRSAVRNAAAYHNQNQVASAWHLTQSTRRKRKAGAKTEASPYSVPFDPAKDTWSDVKERARQLYFPAALEVAADNKARAARLAGLSSSQFYQNLSSRRTEEQTTTDESKEKPGFDETDD